MRRREFITLLGGAAAVWPPAVRAEQPRVARIGFLGAASAAGYAKQLEGFRSGLRELGYIEGRNLAIEFRWADGKYDRLAALATELVTLNVDVLVTHGTPGARAAKKATATVPIVMAVSGNADESGLIQSLARPGGNLTGLTYFASDFASKRIEQIKDIRPGTSQVAFLTNPNNPTIMKIGLEAMEAAARSTNVIFQAFEVRAPAEFDAAFSAMVERGFEVVAVDQDGMLTGNAKAIAALALRRQLASFGEAPYANAGGLFGYGPNYPRYVSSSRALRGQNS
jgi:putative tryptophan/tyrosine transport system substrate-binding protein